MSVEQLVMTTVNALKKNDIYQAEISKIEAFINTIGTQSLTEEQQASLTQVKANMESMKALVTNHKKEIRHQLESRNMGSILELAETLKDIL